MSTDYRLAYGTHATADEGRCAMEWVSYLSGEPHSDSPTCVSPVLRAFCVTLNDSLDDLPRQRLRPYLARTIGTSGDGYDEVRSWLALDWLVRTYTATWLAAAGLGSAAERLSRLPEVAEGCNLQVVLSALRDARTDAHAAGAGVLGTTRAAIWAPWLAGRSAAREAAWTSAGAAAWAAARVAVGDLAGDRARALAREIAGDAAAALTREARSGAGRAAARAAARAALAPTLADLEQSAFGLLDRMLPTIPIPAPAPDGAPGAGRQLAPARLAG